MPWAYLPIDPIWNVVLACEVCNSSKGARTPNDATVDRVIDRNSGLNESLKELRSDPLRLAAAVKETKKWLLQQDPPERFRALVHNCRSEGFPDIWSPPTHALPKGPGGADTGGRAVTRINQGGRAVASEGTDGCRDPCPLD